MKNNVRILPLLLVFLLVFGLIPVTAGAEELPSLTPPTDLEWGYDHVSNTAAPGTISWKCSDPNQNAFYIDLYRVGDSEPYMRYGWLVTHPLDSGWISDWSIAYWDIESGTYYFTVKTIDYENPSNSSETITSDTWTYTKPNDRVGTCANPRWNQSEMLFDKPENLENIRGYEYAFFYAPNPEEEPMWIGSRMCFDGYPYDDYYYMDFYEGLETYGDGYYYFAVRALSTDITVACNGEFSEYSAPCQYVDGRLIFGEEELDEYPNITGTYTTDLVMPAADLGVSAPDAVLRATLTFTEDGQASASWEAVDLTAFKVFFHDMFVNAYYAMAYGAGITDINEIEAFCVESTGMSVSDYMYTIVTDEAMKDSFTPASTQGSYRYGDENKAIFTDLALMDVPADPTVESTFTVGNGTLYLNANAWGKPDYTFVCSAK